MWCNLLGAPGPAQKIKTLARGERRAMIGIMGHVLSPESLCQWGETFLALP